MRSPSTFARATIRAGLLATATLAAVSARSQPSPPASADTAHMPLVGCTSLANLRMVLRQSEGNPVAILAAITNSRSDFGCALVDPAIVTAIAEHVTLNGNAYDCLSLKQTGICHWVVAGTVRPGHGAATTAEQAPPARSKPTNPAAKR